MVALNYNTKLKRNIRTENLQELSVSTVTKINEAIDGGRSEEAKALVDYFRQEMQIVHDIYAEYVQGLLAHIAETYGENAVEAAFRGSLGKWFKERYDAYNRLDLEEKLQLTAEGMRCHLDGPERKGDFTVTEESDRYVFKWDPCGSGGVLRRKAEAEGRELAVARQSHDWTWGKEGVCLYCAHCSLVNEILPIEHYRYPNRITEYPKQPGDPCVWYIYKNPDDIPEEFYARIGKVKPLPSACGAQSSTQSQPTDTNE